MAFDVLVGGERYIERVSEVRRRTFLVVFETARSRYILILFFIRETDRFRIYIEKNAFTRILI